MYEEKKFSNRKIRWISVLIKLALLFLIVFLVWYFIVKHNDNKNSPKKLGAKISDNISYLKKQYIKYFNEKNIPTTKDAETKVYLKELIDSNQSKIIYDKNGEKCSATSSYGKLVKTGDGTYELKIYLKCKNEADSELYSITHKEIIENKSTNNNKSNNNNKNTNTNNNSNNNKNTNNNNNTNTNNNSNKNTNTNTNTKTNTNSNTKTNTNNNTKTNTNNNKTTTTNSNTTNTSKTTSTSTSTKNTTSTKSTSTSTSTSSSSSSIAVTETSTTKPATITEQNIDVDKITSDPSRIVLTEYLLYKLGKASYNAPKDKKYISYQVEVEYYKYCNGNDMVNCHSGFAKIPANEQAIQDLLFYGYTEYLDYVDKVTVFVPVEDELWSSSKEKDGYIYSGQSRTHYRVN